MSEQSLPGPAAHQPRPLERTSILLMIALLFLSLGFYPSIWFLRRRVGLNQLDSPRKLQRWPFILILTFVAARVLYLIIAGPRQGQPPTAAQNTVNLVSWTLQFALGILVIFQSFLVKDILEDHLSGSQERSRIDKLAAGDEPVSGVLTFFFNIFYLQYVINRRVAGAGPVAPEIVGSLAGESFTYAGFWRRLGAYLLDFICTMLITLAIFWLAGSSKRLALLLEIPSIFLSSAYFVVLHGRYGRTLGKVVAHLKVTRDDGTPIGFQDAIVRYLPDFALTSLSGYLMIMGIMNIDEGEWIRAGVFDRGTLLSVQTPELRELYYFLQLGWTLAEVVSLAVSPQKKTLHDRLARTIVVRAVGLKTEDS